MASTTPTAAGAAGPPEAGPGATNPAERAPRLGIAGSLARWERWSLPSILALQALLSLSLMGRAIDADEPTYIDAGHAEIAHVLHGAQVLDYQTLFSGVPVFYPPMAAIADSVGGLTAARLLSLCFMLATTALLWFTARRLFDTRVATTASVLFATTAAAVFLGALATFDALALMLLGAAAWCAVRAGVAGGRGRAQLLSSTAVLLVAANAAKYASALWDPVVIAMVWLSTERGSFGDGPGPGRHRARADRALLQAGLVAAGTLTLAGLAVLSAGPGYWQGIVFTTLHHTSNAGAPRAAIAAAATRWIGICAALAVGGAIALSRSDRPWRMKALGWVLAAAIMLAPVNQYRIDVLISLYKHVGFGAWFAVIPAGYGVSAALRHAGYRIERLGMRALRFAPASLAVTALAASAVVGIYEAESTRTWQPLYTSGEVAYLEPLIRTAPGKLLADTPNQLIYYSHTSPERWFSTLDFTYAPRARPPVAGWAAYAAAIRDNYFGLVILRGYPIRSFAMDRAIVAALRRDHRYRLLIIRAGRTWEQWVYVWVKHTA
jgi:hypothetical protein